MEDTEKFIEALECAEDYARSFSMDEVDPIHVLLGVLTISESFSAKAFEDAGITLLWVNEVMENALGNVDPLDFFDDNELAMGPGTEKVLGFAKSVARFFDAGATVDHLALALLKRPGLHRDIIKLKVPVQDLYDTIFQELLEEHGRRTVITANQVTIEDL